MSRTAGLIGALALLAGVGCSSTTRQEGPDADGGTGGTGGTSATGGSANGGGAGAAGADLCQTYCDTIAASCTGEFAQYTSATTCRELCLLLPPGTPDDQIGNTVGCRLHQAELAVEVGEPDQHCTEAGPGGNGVCGQNCEAYCVGLEQACSARFGGAFDGQADCVQACELLPDEVRFHAGISAGNSIQCRLWHLSAASVDPSAHCGHALGEAPCAP